MYKRQAPVGSGNGIENILAVLVSDTISVLVQLVNSVLLEAPFSVFLDGTDRAKNMEVWVWYAAVLPVWLVYLSLIHISIMRP